jgi:hypothetical protein
VKSYLLVSKNEFPTFHDSGPISVKFGIGGLQLLPFNICYFRDSLCSNNLTFLKDVNDESCNLLGSYAVIVCCAAEVSNNVNPVLFRTLLITFEFSAVQKVTKICYMYT